MAVDTARAESLFLAYPQGKTKTPEKK